MAMTEESHVFRISHMLLVAVSVDSQPMKAVSKAGQTQAKILTVQFCESS